MWELDWLFRPNGSQTWAGKTIVLIILMIRTLWQSSYWLAGHNILLMELNFRNNALSYSVIDRPHQTHRSDGWTTGSPHCPWAVSIWANHISLNTTFHYSRNISRSRNPNFMVSNCIVNDVLYCIKSTCAALVLSLSTGHQHQEQFTSTTCKWLPD